VPNRTAVQAIKPTSVAAASTAAHLHQAVLGDVVRQISHHLHFPPAGLLCVLRLLCLLPRLLLSDSRLLHILLPLAAGARCPLLLRLLCLLRQLGSVLVHAGQQLRQVLPQNVAADQPQLRHLQYR